MKLILNPEYGLYEKDDKIFCDSLQIAETFERQHDNVLRDIRNLDCSDNFSLLNFEESNYKDRGKKYPKYLLTKDGFTFLVMGYRGKKAAQFKEEYINRFNQMEQFIKSLLTSKMEFPAFTEAVMLAHDEPKHYHYSNEIDMIYRIVLGMTAKKYRQTHNLKDGEVIKPYLTANEIKAIETLQRVDIGLLEIESDYYKRQDILNSRYQKINARPILNRNSQLLLSNATTAIIQ